MCLETWAAQTPCHLNIMPGYVTLPPTDLTKQCSQDCESGNTEKSWGSALAAQRGRVRGKASTVTGRF